MTLAFDHSLLCLDGIFKGGLFLLQYPDFLLKSLVLLGGLLVGLADLINFSFESDSFFDLLTHQPVALFHHLH